MRDATIARNYAEALLTLARKANGLDSWGGFIGGLSDAIQSDERLTNFLAAPQVSSADKKSVLEKALGPTMPRPFIKFLHKVIDNRRQTLIPEIATQYASLVDDTAGRVHAHVTVARELADADRDRVAQQLSVRLGKLVVPHVQVNPAILGGIIVRVGDTVMDGSVRRKLTALRSRLTTRA